MLSMEGVYIEHMWKSSMRDCKEPQINDCWCNIIKQVNQCQGDGFLSVDARMGARKLTMAAT